MTTLALARALDDAKPAPRYPRPQPMPRADQRRVRISVTALDRLRSDPYQFYASAILRLKPLDALDAEPTPAWRGTAAHEMLETWHKTGRPMADVAEEVLEQMNAHPLMRALWRPRLMKALEWVETEIAAHPERKPVLFEEWGAMLVRGIEIIGKADRIDRFADGTLAIVDYKTGQPPSGRQVENGYALQLGTTGPDGRARRVQGRCGPTGGVRILVAGQVPKSETGFGYVATPILDGQQALRHPARRIPARGAAHYLDEALDSWILGQRTVHRAAQSRCAGL